jgi:uroporphyrinogen decarboxylase
MGATMTKRERVLAAVQGDEVDRVPVSFWVHNFARENSASSLARESARFLQAYDWDFLKVQSRASYFGEGWGSQYVRSFRSTVGPTLASHGLISVADLARLQPLALSQPILIEQQEALRQTRELVGPDVPILWTIFCPLTIAAALVPEGVEGIREAMRTDPEVLHAGLEAISKTYTSLGRRYLELGADGIFYATKWAGPRMLTREQHQRFARPGDLRVLTAISDAPFNVLHLCAEEIYFADFRDYPAAAVNWEAGNGNPSLAQARDLTDRALLGGVSPKPDFARLTPRQVKAQVVAAIEATGGRHLLVGPGCSVNPGSPAANYRAARDSARAIREPG